MNQSDLVRKAAALADQPVTTTSAVIDAALSIIMEAVTRGDTVRLKGFGQFGVVARGQRPERNPRTGEAKEIPPMRTPKFWHNKIFRDALNGVNTRPKRLLAAKKIASPNEAALPGFE